MKNKKNTTLQRIVPKSNRKITDTEAKSISLHHHSLSKSGTGTSIQSGGVKIVLRAQHLASKYHIRIVDVYTVYTYVFVVLLYDKIDKTCSVMLKRIV